MLEVEIQKNEYTACSSSTTWSRKSTALSKFSLDISEEEVARLQARYNEFGHPEPTQHTRDEASLSRTGVDAHGRKCAWVCLLPQVVDEWVLMMLS